MKKSSIYTRQGDDGTTRRADGSTVPKDDASIEAYGTIDELNSHIGLLATQLPADWRSELLDIQRHLFAIGAYLAGVPSPDYFPTAADVAHLEALMDAMPPFSGFVLPGGSPAAAQAHVCRTVCRRAERRVLTAKYPNALPYLNRLSDYFFCLSRKTNLFREIDENKL